MILINQSLDKPAPRIKRPQHRLARFPARLAGLASAGALAATAACTSAPAPADDVLTAARRTAIVNITLLDGTDRPPLSDAAVILQGDRIWWAGRRAEAPLAGAGFTLNAGGRVAVPGLIDLHQHAAGIAVPAREWLKHGVTSVRDPGADLEMRRPQRSGAPARREPRLFAGLLIDLRAGQSPESVRALVSREAALGVDLLKLYLRTPVDHAQAAVEEAAAHGLPVTWHLGPSLSEALALGIDGVEHLYIFRELMPEPGPEAPTTADAFLQIHERWAAHLRPDTAAARALFAEMAARGLVWTPTLTLHEQIASGRSEWTRSWTAPQIEAGMRGFEAACAMVGGAHRAGVRIGAGTDTDAPDDLHRELGFLVRCGLDPAAALRSATSTAAFALGQEEALGTVKSGLLADLLILEANPLEDIANTRRIWRVIQAGDVLDPAALGAGD